MPDWFEKYLAERQKELKANPPPVGPEITIDTHESYSDGKLFIERLNQVTPKQPLIDNKRALTPLIRAQQKETPPGTPPPKPPTPSPKVELPPLEEPLPPLPPVEDSPQKQAAPDVPAEIRIDIRPSPGPVEPTRVPEYYWSLTGPAWPRSIADLIGLISMTSPAVTWLVVAVVPAFGQWTTLLLPRIKPGQELEAVAT